MVRLDDVFGSASIALLKADVEGQEYGVLKGASAKLARKEIHTILLEYGCDGSTVLMERI
jgi:FkbM family methyltransferase